MRIPAVKEHKHWPEYISQGLLEKIFHQIAVFFRKQGEQYLFRDPLQFFLEFAV